MSDPNITNPTSSAMQLVVETRQETAEIHGDTARILDLLNPPQEEGEDRIDQILAALAEALTSLASAHEKIDRLAVARK
jgi:hypothetical protein